MSIHDEVVEEEEPPKVPRPSMVGVFIYQISRFITYGNALLTNREDADLSFGDSHVKIRARIKSNALISYEFLTMNTFATIIACCGLATNSMIVIVGAMTIAMLLEPIMGVALAIVDGDKRLLAQALFTVLAGSLTVFFVSFAFSVVYRYHVTNLPDSNLMQYATPHLLDLIVAIIGGAAGAYTAMSRRLRLGLAGVALSITLMPPLAAAGIFLAHGSLSHAAGCLLSFMTNLIGVQFTASIVFWIYGFHSDVPATRTILEIIERNMISVVMIFLLAIMLSINLKHVLDKQRFEQDTKTTILNRIATIPGAYLADLRFEKRVVVAVVRSPVDITIAEVDDLAAHLPKRHGKPPTLTMRVVKVSSISSHKM